MEISKPTEVYLWQWVHRLPNDRLPVGWSIWRNFVGLQYASADFQNALQLYDHLALTLPTLEDYRTGMSWQSIAQREGCMQVYHFGQHVLGLTKNFGGKSGILPSLDRRALRDLWGSFLEYFPDWEGARHSIAHHGDMGATPEEAAKHVLKEPAFGIAGSEGSFMTYTNGRRYSATHMGALRTIELSVPSLEKLRSTRSEIDTLLNPALKPFYDETWCPPASS